MFSEFKLERFALARLASICALALVASLVSRPGLAQDESLEETREAAPDPGALFPQLETPRPEEERLFEEYPWDKYRLDFGGFVATVDSGVRLGLTGIDIDLEEALDLDTTLTAFSLGGEWCFSDNLYHTFKLDWKSIRRSAVAPLGRDIEIDGEVFPLGTRVASRLDIDLINLAQDESLEETQEAAPDPGALFPQLETPRPEEERLFEEYPWDKYRLEFGGFVATVDSGVRLGLTGVGIDIDLEETLDLDTTLTAFSLGGEWRFSDNLRHTFRLDWRSIRRSAERTLGRDIEIDGEVFPLGTRVESRLDIDLIKGAYNYSFFLDDRIDLALGIGLYVVPLNFDIEAKGVLIDLQKSEHVIVPLPLVGLNANFAITPRFFLKSRLEFFYLAIGDYRGLISDFEVALEYRPWEHVGIGLGIESFRVRVEADGNDYPGVDLHGEITFDYGGLFLYGTIVF